MREWCQKSTFLYIFRIASMCYETRGHVWQGCHMADFFMKKWGFLYLSLDFYRPANLNQVLPYSLTYRCTGLHIKNK
jgi:hypothetical protein